MTHTPHHRPHKLGTCIGTLTIAGVDRGVYLRAMVNSRRMTLRLDPATDQVLLTAPPHVNHIRALHFAESKVAWLENAAHRLPKRIALADGSIIPIAGENITICHKPEARKGVWREGHCLYVSGQTAHLPRRVTDYLKKECQRIIPPIAHHYARLLEVHFAKISVRDQKSRWGSCSAAGNLAFSWRLICAPPYVLGYVVAHEIAHLRELNHSPKFWHLLDSICPDRLRAEAWLSEHGTSLHRIS
jgi:predicted metal-dependent hydrolase